MESNLLSGRQYVASEPPVSDTSDSEGSYSSHCSRISRFQSFFLRIAFDGDDPNRALTRSIRREVAKLTEQWSHLINRSDGWKHRLDEYMTVSIEICISWFRLSRRKEILIEISRTHHRRRRTAKLLVVSLSTEREFNFQTARSSWQHLALMDGRWDSDGSGASRR